MQLNGRSLAERRAAVLAGTRLTSTGLEKVRRDELERLAAELGASWSDELTTETTHLVANVKRSAKCDAASHLGILIVREDWIRDCHTSASRLAESEYRLPALFGCVIASTNFDINQREAIKQTVLELGGEYAGALDREHTTHLVCNEPFGDKFEHATRWRIPIATVDWLEACRSARSLVDPTPYFPQVLDAVPDRHTLVERKLEQLTVVAELAPVSDIFEPYRFFVHGTPPDALRNSTPCFRTCLNLINRGRGLAYPSYFSNLISHIIVPPDALPLPRAAAHRTYDVHHNPTLTFLTADWLAQSLQAETRLPVADFQPAWL